MPPLCLFLVLSAISASCAQNHGYFVKPQLFLREEKIPAVVTYLLYNHDEQFESCTTSDVVQLGHLDRYDLTKTLDLLQLYGITSEEAFTIENLHKTLGTLNITYSEFHSQLQQKLGLSNPQMAQLLTTLEIPPTYWMTSSLNDAQGTYENLKQGNYDQEHADAALEVASTNLEKLFEVFRDIIIEKIEKFTISEALKAFETRGWTQEDTLHFCETLNISSQDLHSVIRFRQRFDKISESLNNNSVIGVFVKPKLLAVHEQHHLELVRIVDKNYIKVEADKVEVILQSEYLGKSIVGLPTGAPHEYIDITSEYNSTDVCQYVTFLNGRKQVEDIEVEEVSFNKTENTVFQVGALVICEEELYGLATEETNDSITFDRFYTSDNPPKDEDHGFINSGVGMISATMNFFIALLVLVN